MNLRISSEGRRKKANNVKEIGRKNIPVLLGLLRCTNAYLYVDKKRVHDYIQTRLTTIRCTLKTVITLHKWPAKICTQNSQSALL